MDLTDYGYIPVENCEGGTPARVTAVYKERFILMSEYGVCAAVVKSGVYYNGETEEFPTVGDFVLIDYNAGGDSRITKTLPRRSFFARHAPGREERMQAIAANFDYVFVMQSLNADFNPRRLERYLTLAWQSGAVPVVLLTKADLAENAAQITLAAMEAAAGADIIEISAKTGYGLDRLSNYLEKGRTAVCLGSSGVGKSSLLNALMGKEVMETGEIREDDCRGRHTTTHRQLFLLPSGAMIIDTPGMREMGMWDVSSGLSDTFTDVERYFPYCRFSDCAHGAEPGCAVRAAIESGELPLERWESYQKLKKEAAYSESRASYLRLKEQRFKRISQLNKLGDKG